jgi:hypothetical protein
VSRSTISRSFGIGCEREHTLEEIGQEFDVTRERIRQIEAKALRQLRSRNGRAICVLYSLQGKAAPPPCERPGQALGLFYFVWE